MAQLVKMLLMPLVGPRLELPLPLHLVMRLVHL